jgi:hypothetical protein
VDFRAPPARDGAAWRFRVRAVATADAPHGPRRVWVRGDGGRLGTSGWVTPTGRARHATAEVTLEEPRTVRAVVQLADGTPRPGCSVRLRVVAAPGPGQALGATMAEDEAQPWREYATDPAGRFELTVPARGRFDAILAWRLKDFHTLAIPTDGSELRWVPAEPEPPLRRVVAGSIHGPDGAALPGVRLGFPNREQAIADARGRFTHSSWALWPGPHPVPVSQDGFVLGTCQLEIGPEERQEVVLRLGAMRPSRRLRLSVRDEAGPTVGMKATVWPVAEDGATAPEEATTDGEGVAALRVAPADEYLVHIDARAEPYPSKARAARRGGWHRIRPDADGSAVIDIASASRVSMIGHVVGADDGVRHARQLVAHLLLGGDEDSTLGIESAGTTSDGRFVFDELLPGRYWITAQVAAGDAWAPVRFGPVAVAASGTGVRLRFDPPGCIEGRVLDAAGRPIHGALVQAAWPGAPDPSPRHYAWEQLARVETGPDGVFRLAPIPAGPIRVSVWFGEEPLGVTRIEVPPGAAVWHEFTAR